MAVDEELVERAFLPSARRRCTAQGAVSDRVGMNEDGLIDGPGVIVHQRFGRSQAAAVVPGAGEFVALTRAIRAAPAEHDRIPRRGIHAPAAPSPVGSSLHLLEGTVTAARPARNSNEFHRPKQPECAARLDHGRYVGLQATLPASQRISRRLPYDPTDRSPALPGLPAWACRLLAAVLILGAGRPAPRLPGPRLPARPGAGRGPLLGLVAPPRLELLQQGAARRLPHPRRLRGRGAWSEQHTGNLMFAVRLPAVRLRLAAAASACTS